MKSFQRDRENIIVKNKSLAEFNISQQPAFESLKQQVARSYEEVNNLKLSLGKDVAKLGILVCYFMCYISPSCTRLHIVFVIINCNKGS